MEPFSKIRKPAVAGKFYDGDPETLQDQIFDMIEKISLEIGDEPAGKCARALIVPHAGYAFSGMTAVKTFLRTRGRKYDKLLIIAPSHHVPFQGLAAADYESFRTPIGDIQVDSSSVEAAVAAGKPLIQIFDSPHESEHALEVMLPIAQEILKDFKLIPFICGYVDNSSASKIAETLKGFWRDDILWIISSDFTHYGSYFNYLPFKSAVKQNLKKLDQGAIGKITSIDPDGFSEYIKSTGATICGANPILILLSLLKKLKEEGSGISSELVEYTTSGEQSGDWTHCVSYAGIAFYDK